MMIRQNEIILTYKNHIPQWLIYYNIIMYTVSTVCLCHDFKSFRRNIFRIIKDILDKLLPTEIFLSFLLQFHFPYSMTITQYY